MSKYSALYEIVLSEFVISLILFIPDGFKHNICSEFTPYLVPFVGMTSYNSSSPLPSDITFLGVESSPITKSPTEISCTILIVPSYINIGVS